MKKKSLLIVLLLSLFCAGCAIPVVGNSPEEIKHRKAIYGVDD